MRKRNMIRKGTGAQRLPDDLVVFEIIKRLPIRDVIRFKCVSKYWSSIIQNPQFSQAYRDFNPSCLIVSISSSKENSSDRFYYSPIHEPQTKLIPLRKNEFLPLLHDAKETGVVNGLVCRWSYHWSNRYLFICNVFTGEIMKLPDPPPQYPLTCSRWSFQYYLGYDPVNRLYKLLCRRNFSRSSCHYQPIDFQQSYILTLENNSSWKELVLAEDKRFYSLRSFSICINGVLYWIENVPKSGDMSFPTVGSCLRFFNLSDSEEKIGYCSIPTYFRNKDYEMVQFRGRLSLISWKDKQVTFYTLEDCVGNQGNWVSHELFLPSEFHEDGKINWTYSLPTGMVLLGTNRCVVYSYHYENGRTFSRHIFSEIGENGYLNYVFCGEPNITSLDTLINGGHV